MDLVFNLSTHTVKQQQLQKLINETVCITSLAIIIPFVNFQQICEQINKYLHYQKNKLLMKFHIVPMFDIQKNLANKMYDVAAVGGTFDYLHIGHKVLLIYCALTAKKELIIGITGSQMLKKKKNKEIIQSYATRKKNVIQFIQMIRPDLKISPCQLTDPYGPTIIRQDIDVIIVSQQTIPGGQAINKIRKQKNFKQLQMIVCPALSQDPNTKNKVANKISSSIIRQQILKKNSMTVQQFSEYKQFWSTNIKQFQKILRIKQELHNQKYNQCLNEWWDWIIFSYSEYWRHYHTNYHILTLLKNHIKNKQSKKIELSQIQQVIFTFSIFFHDSIYITTGKNNQKKSAQYLQKFFKECFENVTPFQTKKILHEIINQCKDIILATQKHDSKTNLEIYVNDLDMGILNAEEQQYKIYANQIKKQYQPSVGKENYPKKRIQFLTSFDPKTVIKEASVQKVENNIKWQIEHLKKNQIKQL